MFLTNLVLSAVLNFQPVMTGYDFSKIPDSGYNNFIRKMPYFLGKNQRSNDYQLIRMGNYLQSFSLIYQDIYIYTRPNLYQMHEVNGKRMITGEANPVADLFFKNNLWELAFVCANAVNYVIYSNDYLYYFYSSALTIAEVFAISTWDGLSDHKIDLHANVFALTF